MRIALAHDYLTQDGGAERTFEAITRVWPDAPIYTLFFDPRRVPRFARHDVRTSFLQRLPGIKTHWQWYLPLMPTGTESLDLRDYEVVVSSTSAFFKGLITKPDAVHVCYCHTPTRYLWTDSHDYVREVRAPRLLKQTVIPPTLTWLRVWDRLSADRVTQFVANSRTVQQRIKRYYDRDSVIIHPPVEIQHFAVSNAPKTYFLSGGRMVPYKRFDVLVRAFNRLGLPLKLFGTGPMFDILRRHARSNIEFLGNVPTEQKAELYANCTAFLHPHEEDFGITAVEANASGRPVIAFRRGGAEETVIEGVTGEFFDEQNWETIADHVLSFDPNRYDPIRMREHAKQFDVTRFERELANYVSGLCAKSSSTSVI